MRNRVWWFIGTAAVVGSTVLLLILWSKSWNNPTQKLEWWNEPNGRYHGEPIYASMTCNCPSTLIESQKQVLAFAISLSRPKQASGAPAGQHASPAETIYAWVDSANANTAPLGT